MHALVTPQPALPMSPEEAAALASRTRVAARLPRITAVGAGLGLVCGAVAIWPFLSSDEFLVQAMVRGGVGGVLSVALPLALAGCLPLLLFYSLRLQAGSRSTYAAVEDNLRKIRRILAACMFLSAGSIAFVLVSWESAGELGLVTLYGLCLLACGLIVGDVRQALGEFETADERRRRRMARGFEVELKSRGVEVAGQTPSAPVALAPLPAQPVTGLAPAPAPPPLPVSVLPVNPPQAASLPVAPRAWGTGQAERDLRTLLHLLAATGVGVYLFRSPLLARNLSSYGSLGMSVVGWRGGGAGMSAELEYACGIAQLTLAACGVAWVVWGILTLCFGARLRIFVLILAGFSLGAVLVFTLAQLAIVVGDFGGGWVSLVQTGEFTPDFSHFLPYLAELVHGLVIIVMLTRPRVKDLFARGSEAGEGSG